MKLLRTIEIEVHDQKHCGDCTVSGYNSDGSYSLCCKEGIPYEQCDDGVFRHLRTEVCVRDARPAENCANCAHYDRFKGMNDPNLLAFVAAYVAEGEVRKLNRLPDTPFVARLASRWCAVRNKAYEQLGVSDLLGALERLVATTSGEESHDNHQ